MIFGAGGSEVSEEFINLKEVSGFFFKVFLTWSLIALLLPLVCSAVGCTCDKGLHRKGK